MWYVYIVKCSDKTLYTGISNDLKKRIKQHNTSPLGAKYTKPRRPVKLVYSSEAGTKAEALKKEYKIKQLSRQQKIELIKN